MNTYQAVKFLESRINDSKAGLPEDIFLFISRLTPLVNVDLLIKDEVGRTLLSWRDDEICGRGWHVPGGIVRFKERFEDRIQKVANTEIGCLVEYNSVPLAFNQIILNQESRGHSVSFLYKCFLSRNFILNQNGLKDGDKGFLKWHDMCPDDILYVHKMYKVYM